MHAYVQTDRFQNSNDVRMTNVIGGLVFLTCANVRVKNDIIIYPRRREIALKFDFVPR